MDTNHLILSALYLFHMTASILWAGSALMVFLDNRAAVKAGIAPGARLKPGRRKQLFLAGWFCLAVIGATGMFQMSANSAYQGFLMIDNAWSQALLVKHLLILVFLALLGYVSGVMEGRFERLSLRAQKDPSTYAGPAAREAQLENRVLMLIFGLFLLILVFTSLARAA